MKRPHWLCVYTVLSDSVLCGNSSAYTMLSDSGRHAAVWWYGPIEKLLLLRIRLCALSLQSAIFIIRAAQYWNKVALLYLKCLWFYRIRNICIQGKMNVFWFQVLVCFFSPLHTFLLNFSHTHHAVYGNPTACMRRIMIGPLFWKACAKPAILSFN